MKTLIAAILAGSILLPVSGLAMPAARQSAMSNIAKEASLPPVSEPRQSVYWTLFADSSYPQVQIAKVPMSGTSTAVTIRNTQQNNLLETSGVTF